MKIVTQKMLVGQELGLFFFAANLDAPQHPPFFRTAIPIRPSSASRVGPAPHFAECVTPKPRAFSVGARDLARANSERPYNSYFSTSYFLSDNINYNNIAVGTTANGKGIRQS